MTDLEKAKILYECKMWLAGNGHFDLTVEDTAEVLRLLKTKRSPETLRNALTDFYENHPPKVEIDRAHKEDYEQY